MKDCQVFGNWGIPIKGTCQCYEKNEMINYETSMVFKNKGYKEQAE